MIKLGSNSIGKIYLGSNSIGKAYLGSSLVFQKGGGTLPYTPVAYIQTDGVAYIDTNIKGNTPKSSELKLAPVMASTFATHLGSRLGDNRHLLVCQWGNSGYAYDNYITYSYYNGTNQGISMATSITNYTPLIVRTKLNSNEQYFGIKQQGESQFTEVTASFAHSVSTNLNMYLFARNQDGSASQNSPSGTRVYYCKIYSDVSFSTLVFDGVPCVYNNAYGLWDKVSNSFFGNAAGSGAFSGPQI